MEVSVSKASEWVKLYKQYRLERPIFKLDDDKKVAIVSMNVIEKPTLELSTSFLSVPEALRLASWIIETFGEEK